MVESDLESDLRLVGSLFQELLAVAGSGILTHVDADEKEMLRERGLVSHVKVRSGGWIYVLTPYCRLLMAKLHHD